eukprot:COSAG04_NODE_190_length_20948_cov_7.298863_16_plen_194_part_00
MGRSRRAIRGHGSPARRCRPTSSGRTASGTPTAQGPSATAALMDRCEHPASTQLDLHSMAEAEGTVGRQSDQSASGSHLATVDQRLVEQRQIRRRRHATATGPTQRPSSGSVGVVLLRLRQAHLRARIDEIQSATGRSWQMRKAPAEADADAEQTAKDGHGSATAAAAVAAAAAAAAVVAPLAAAGACDKSQE